MGSRSPVESTSRILLAFLRQSTWTQAELARHLELTTKRTVQLLRVLEPELPLHRDEEHPHVYWSVERGWFPLAGRVVSEQTIDLALRLVARLPSTTQRDEAVRGLVASLPDRRAEVLGHDDVTIPHDGVLNVLEDANRQSQVARIRYFSAHRGDTDDRSVSIHRVSYRGPTQFVATCHRADALRWFRADRVERAVLVSDEPFRRASHEQIDAFIASSVGGFRADEPIAEHVCFVRDPEARWVKRNLPGGATVELCSGGVRLTWRVAAVLPLARFVVGIGEAARPESAALRDQVEALARGALNSIEASRNV